MKEQFDDLLGDDNDDDFGELLAKSPSLMKTINSEDSELI